MCTSGVLVGLDDTRIYPVNAGGAKNWQHYANLLSVRASLAKPCPFWTIYITARVCRFVDAPCYYRAVSSRCMFGVLRFFSGLSIYTEQDRGSSLWVGSYSRLGSTGGVFSKVGFGDVLSVLAAHQLGPALSLRSFSRVTPSLGGPPSLLSHTTLASSVSCRPQTRLGDSVSVSGFSSMGSALPLRT